MWLCALNCELFGQRVPHPSASAVRRLLTKSSQKIAVIYQRAVASGGLSATAEFLVQYNYMKMQYGAHCALQDVVFVVVHILRPIVSRPCGLRNWGDPLVNASWPDVIEFLLKQFFCGTSYFFLMRICVRLVICVEYSEFLLNISFFTQIWLSVSVNLT